MVGSAGCGADRRELSGSGLVAYVRLWNDKLLRWLAFFRGHW